MFYLNYNKYGEDFAAWLMSHPDVDCVWDEDGLGIFSKVDTKELYKEFKETT